MGESHGRGRYEARPAPAALPSSAHSTSGSTVAAIGVMRRTYVQEETAVPAAEATLFVPSTAPVDASAGSAVSRAGSWISPPPPTTASTQPARKAAPTSSTSVRAESCSSWSSRGTAPVNTAPRTGDESVGGLTDCRDASSDLGPRRHPRGHLPGRRPGAGPRDPGPAERCSAPRGGAADPGLERPRRTGPGRPPRRPRAARARGVPTLAARHAVPEPQLRAAYESTKEQWRTDPAPVMAGAREVIAAVHEAGGLNLVATHRERGSAAALLAALDLRLDD